MTKRDSPAHTVGLLLLFSGILLGFLYAGVSVWGDLEALPFDTATSYQSEGTLSTLRCPVLMTTGEKGQVSVTIENPIDRTITRTVRVRISAGDILAKREYTEHVALEPGESRQISWEIFPQDRVFNLFVLVRVYLFRGSLLPSKDGACGVMVVDLPGWHGGTIVASVIIASVVCMGAGAFLVSRGLHEASRRTRELAQSGMAMAVIVVVGMAAGFLGWLWVGSAALVLLFLLAVVTIGRSARTT